MTETVKKDSMLKRFASYYKPYMGLFIADLFFASIEGAVGLAFPSIIRYLINDIFVMPEKSLILPILIKTALCGRGHLSLFCDLLRPYHGSPDRGGYAA